MSNESGQAYGLTVLSPITPGEEGALKQFLAGLPTGENAPFHRTPTHTSRWVVVEQLPEDAWPKERDPEGQGRFENDRLQSSYLLFDSNFDAGDDGLRGYLAKLVAKMPTEIEAIYRHCVGYTGLERFAHYIDECQIKTTFFFSSYASELRGTVENVQAALLIQSGFVDLVADSQGRPPTYVQDRLKQFLQLHRISAPLGGPLPEEV
jgi:hypothetical protein